MGRWGAYAMLVLCGLLTVGLAVWLFADSTAAQALPLQKTIAVHLANGQGTVLGNYGETTWSHQRFMQFRGIPFAEPPVGELRFQPPVPRAPWTKTLNALDYGRRCPVITNLDTQVPDVQLEDCLNLCVYTKNLTARRPVMFYVYGGGYYNGSSSDHPPNYLLEQDVVLVVSNFRIGALGWLASYSDELPGNVPIADILLALDWVQQHIHLFGGAAQQVTLFGQSAGASIVSALLLSPRTLEQQTFHRAIVQSGSILANWASRKDPQVQAARACRRLGCNECDQTTQLVKCLRASSVLNLLQATKEEIFSPIIGDLLGILPQHPNELIKLYKRNIPLMTGFTEHDGTFVLAIYYDEMAAKFNISTLTVREFSQGLIDMANDVTGLTDNLLYRLLYTPEILASRDHKLAIPSYFDLTSYIFMKSPVISLASKLFLKHTSAPVYLYSFEYEGEYTRFGYEMGNEQYPFNGGVHHSNDNIYLFATRPLEGLDLQMARRMVELWTSFACNNVDKHINAMTSANGPYNRIGLDIQSREDILQSLTAAIDDPNNERFQRQNVEF